MAQIQLIHPIYLDVPMLVSFAAALDGGIAFASDITHEKTGSTDMSGQVSAKAGPSKLLSGLFSASIEAVTSAAHANQNQEIRRESKAHTEASIAIVLYDRLTQEKGQIIRPDKLEDIAKLEPGTLIELAGVLEKNAIDATIDYIDAVSILSRLDPNSSKDKEKSGMFKNLTQMRESLEKDRKRTPISNVLLRCSQPEGLVSVVTLRTANLRDLTLSELHKNNVRVVGKITRIVEEGVSMCAFENYGMGLLPAATLRPLFDGISKSGGIKAEFSDVEVQGPAIQILPLMIFV